MVAIAQTGNNFIFEIKGFHKFWALRSTIIVPKEKVIKAYQDKNELRNFKGFRIGTYIPFLITAGTFSWKGKRNFWDVMKKKDTIIVELKDHSYNKLYIQVENPEAALQLLNSK